MRRRSSRRISASTDLLPIAKLTNGFSVALFAKQGSPLKTWAELAAAETPLKVSSLQRATAAYVAALMIERKGGLATRSRCATRSARWSRM